MRDASDGIRADAQNALDNPSKTKAGNRQILMTEEVKAAFREERRCQESNGRRCKIMVDGYTNFIFINRFGNLQH